MAKKIIFQKCNFNNIYFLFYFIISFINHLIERNLFSLKEESNKNNSKFNKYLPAKMLNNIYIANISDFLAIIPHLIRKKLLKKKQEKITPVEIEDNKESEDLKLIYNDKNILITNKKKKKILLYCIVVGILDFLEKFSLILYYILFVDEESDIYAFSCIVPFEIICQYICSFIILKIHFYKLQYFSLFLNLGIFIIILIIDIYNCFKNVDSKIWRMYFFYLFNIIFYSIEYSLGKKIFLYGFISIYLLIIIKGFVVLILSFLFSMIILLVDKDIFVSIGFFFREKKYIGLLIAKIFSDFFYCLFTWLIIDRFSPNYFPLSLLMYELCSFLVDIIYKKENNFNNLDFYIRIFLYLVSAIGVIIHNEIVVINICNLGSDTKYFLDLEVKSEELFANTDNPEIIKRYDSLAEEEKSDEQSNENEEILN